MVAAKLIEEPSAEFLDQQMGGFGWYLLFASQTSLFVQARGLFPGCLDGTATGILVLGMHCTFYLLSEH